MRELLFVCVLSTALAIPGPASAAVLATAPATANFAGQSAMYCQIVNIGTKTASITVESRDFSGAVQAAAATDLLPGAVYSLLETGAGTYCVFTVPRSARKFRAAAIYYNAGAYTMAIPAY